MWMWSDSGIIAELIATVKTPVDSKRRIPDDIVATSIAVNVYELTTIPGDDKMPTGLQGWTISREVDMVEPKRRTKDEAFGGRKMGERRYRQMSCRTYVVVHDSLKRDEFRLARIAAPENYLARSGIVVEAVMANFLTRPEAEQEAILREGARVIEAVNVAYDGGGKPEPLTPGSYADPIAKPAAAEKPPPRGLGAARIPLPRDRGTNGHDEPAFPAEPKRRPKR
jgi:hypothetical protein